jgi:hypothetical protein
VLAAKDDNDATNMVIEGKADIAETDSAGILEKCATFLWLSYSYHICLVLVLCSVRPLAEKANIIAAGRTSFRPWPL